MEAFTGSFDRDKNRVVVVLPLLLDLVDFFLLAPVEVGNRIRAVVFQNERLKLLKLPVCECLVGFLFESVFGKPKAVRQEFVVCGPLDIGDLSRCRDALADLFRDIWAVSRVRIRQRVPLDVLILMKLAVLQVALQKLASHLIVQLRLQI